MLEELNAPHVIPLGQDFYKTVSGFFQTSPPSIFCPLLIVLYIFTIINLSWEHYYLSLHSKPTNLGVVFGILIHPVCGFN